MRQPLSFVNKRGQTLICSLYHSVDVKPLDGGPCVIYMHGNASSQLEGKYLVPSICPHGIFMFLFDFAGCGCSDGEYISLGFFERQDVELLMNILHDQFNLGPFILWGRSMGAAACILANSPLIVGKISDSSFTTLPDECAAIAHSTKLPEMFVPSVIKFLKKKIGQSANFDIDDVSPINAARNQTYPIVLGHAEDDEFIPFSHCLALSEAYPGKDKFVIPFKGGHNGRRPIDWLKLCLEFILNNFHMDASNIHISPSNNLWNSDSHFASFQDMFQVAQNEPNLVSVSDFSTSMHEEEDDKDSPLFISAQNITPPVLNTEDIKDPDESKKKHHHNHHHSEKHSLHHKHEEEFAESTAQ